MNRRAVSFDGRWGERERGGDGEKEGEMGRWGDGEKEGRKRGEGESEG